MLDNGAWTPCSSPQPYANLGAASHTFSVRATDAAGNTDATPATYTWQITATPVQCGLCVLEGTQTGLELNSSGQVNVTNAGVNVNSTDPSQAVKVGGTGKVTATYIGGPAAPNGFQATGSGIYNPAPMYLPAINDPLATLAQCSSSNSACPTTVRSDVILNQSQTATIQPGIYSAIEASGNAKLTLAAGTYVVKKWMKIGQQASITSSGGVTIYLACQSYPNPCTPSDQGAVIELTGTGTLSMSAPTTGAYKGGTVFADRNNTATSKVSGQGSSFGGTVYMKSGRLQLTGNGNTLNSRIVVDTAIISGTGSLTINPVAGQNY